MQQYSFRPRARILKLLGDQLIGSSRLAIFELVKNAYDADADSVKVIISTPEKKAEATIEVIDFGGEGMTMDTIINIWLEPGAEHKEIKRQNGETTKKYNRLPLGEKGVGRFAVHKLGNKIKINTKSEKEPEYVIEIDWNKLLENKYIDEAPIDIREASSSEIVFKNNTTGTRIFISELNETFNAKQVRDIYRTINSINYPFSFEKSPSKKEYTKFNVDFELNSLFKEDWMSGLFKIEDILNESLYKFSFILTKDGLLSFDYDFVPDIQMSKSLKIEKRHKCITDEKLRLERNGNPVKSAEYYRDLGDIYGEFYVYDFDNEVNMQNYSIGLKSYLDEVGGVRVYRDGIRVYNYGEKFDDWLNLDKRRVNRLVKGINKRLIIGAIELSLAATPNLQEKTNREGFVENETYEKLQNVITSILGYLENERVIDKNRIKTVAEKEPTKSITNIDEPINELKKELKQKEALTEKTQDLIKRIEISYKQMTDIMLNTGVAGLNLSIAFHEMYHEVKNINRIIKSSNDPKDIISSVERLSELLDSYARLIKKDKPQVYNLQETIKHAVDFTATRYKIHNINLICPCLEQNNNEAKAFYTKSGILGCLSNIIDNSIYWIESRWGDQTEKGLKNLFIGITDEFEKGPAIIIADNGKGFGGMAPKDMVTPFVTNKTGGMGVGLYFVKVVMEMLDGEVLFLSSNELEIDIPKCIDGAVVALVFNKEGKET